VGLALGVFGGGFGFGKGSAINDRKTERYSSALVVTSNRLVAAEAKIPKSRLLSPGALGRVKQGFADLDKSTQVQVEYRMGSDEGMARAKQIDFMLGELGFPGRGLASFGGAAPASVLSIGLSKDLMISISGTDMVELRPAVTRVVRTFLDVMGQPPKVEPLASYRTDWTNCILIVVGD
jgi:hypothetical protein